MRIIKLDDYKSWMFEAGTKRIALDPWLTDVIEFPAGAWMFERRRLTQLVHRSVGEGITV